MAPRWCCHGDTKVLFGVLFLRQTQLAGARDSFGAPLDLEFAKDLPIVSLDRVQGEEEPLANLVIGESLSNEPEGPLNRGESTARSGAELIRCGSSVCQLQMPPATSLRNRVCAPEQRPQPTDRPSACLRQQSCARMPQAEQALARRRARALPGPDRHAPGAPPPGQS